MTNAIQVLQYNGHNIEFKLSGKLMINATEMGRIFGKRPNDYLRLDRSKAFIAACLNWALQDNADQKNNGISRFIGIKSEHDLVKRTQKSGTWMNRIVAFDFAAWLDPTFAVWLYIMVDQVLLSPSATTAVPFSLTANAELRKQVQAQIEADEAVLLSVQSEQKRIEAETNAKLIRDRLGKNRKRLQALDREVVTQYELFISQQDTLHPNQL